MSKIKGFLKAISITTVLGVITELYLLLIILSNLYFITQATSYFDIGKYTLSTIIAIFISTLLEISKRNK